VLKVRSRVEERQVERRGEIEGEDGSEMEDKEEFERRKEGVRCDVGFVVYIRLESRVGRE
jgi:hypothetical protein